MAEAGVVGAAISSYYCHKCSTKIDPKLPDYVCPRCDSGFIEELTSDLTEQNRSIQTDPAAHFAEMWGRSFFGGLHGNSRHPPEDQRSEGRLPGPHFAFTARTTGTNGPSPAIESFVQHLLGGLAGGAIFSGGAPLGFNLHGNPGDYAWGNNGLDSIISQLLNQIDGVGPPPADKKRIEELETVNIPQGLVDKNTQCSVCWDDFNLDEEVKLLPCNHHYHKDCIVPWLKLHGTCPVCRKNLDGEDTSDKDYEQFPAPSGSMDTD